MIEIRRKKLVWINGSIFWDRIYKWKILIYLNKHRLKSRLKPLKKKIRKNKQKKMILRSSKIKNLRFLSKSK